MRLAIVTTIDIGSLNGPAVHVLNQTNGLSRLGHDVTLLAPRSEAPPSLALAPAVHLQLFPSARRVGLGNAFGAPLAWSRLWHLRRHDAIIVRASAASVAITAFARLVGVRRIVVEANGWLSDEIDALGKGRLAVGVARTLQVTEARLADAVRCVTAGLRDQYLQAGLPPARIVHIGNGTDLDVFRPLDRSTCRSAFGYADDETVLAFIGNLWPAIDFDTVFAALAKPILASRKLRLVIVGDGTDADAAKSSAKALETSASHIRIDWHGAQPQEHANRVLSAADVALAPFRSIRNEKIGLSPLKLRDYAAAGSRVVCTRISGIAPGPGWLWLADAGSADAFATAIDDALGADLAQARHAARNYAERHFNWDAIMRRIAALAAGDAANHDQPL